VLRCVERLPGRDERARRQRGETRGERRDLVREGSVVDALPDQAEPDRVLGAELVGQHGQAERVGATDQTRQQPRAAAIGDQADLRERLDEARRASGDDEVAEQREIRSCAGGDAVDRRHDRHRHRADAQRERLVEALDRRADIGGGGAGLAIRRDRRIGEILAGAETSAGAGDDDAADTAIACRCVERRAQFAVHSAGEAVERLRPVQSERANAAGIADANERFFQGVSPLRAWARNIIDRPVGNSVKGRQRLGKRGVRIATGTPAAGARRR
jgi:hypothetical protein